MHRIMRTGALTFAALLTLASAGCAYEPANVEAGQEEFATQVAAITIPSKGSASTLDLANWNLEWFGDAANGPSNNTLQLSNARDVILGAGFDVWGLQEIVSQSQFNSLESQLSGYAGFTASESVVTNGAAYYGAAEQKLALLYKTSVATLVSARVILTGNDYDFAGRPPLEARLNVTVNGVTAELVVIVVHMKASADSASWQRRQNAASALKSYLDTTYPTTRVVVLGDFNDDLDTSIVAGKATPYASFVADSADYTFPTYELSSARISTTVSYPDAVDHQLVTNDLYAGYVAGSADVYRVDEYIPNYATTTSDHYPVYSQFTLGAGGGGTASLVLNEILANEPGSSTAGEFVEIVNAGSAAASLGGYTLRDASGTRHTFAAGTSLAAGKAIVVYGAASAIPAGLTNAVGASTGTLSLANSGDTVSLRDGSGAVVATYTYGSALASVDGVSMTRASDGSASASFVLHTSVSSLQASPGKRTSGASF